MPSKLDLQHPSNHTPKTNVMTSTPYKRVLRYTLTYKRFFILSVLGFCLFASMEMMLIKMLEFFVDRLEGRPSTAITVIPSMWELNPIVIPSQWTSLILFVPIGIIVLSFVRGIGSFFGNFFLGLVGLNVVTDMRRDTFSKMILLPQRFFDERNSGELLSLIIYNIEQVAGSVTDAIKVIFRDGLQVVFFLGAMFYINWKITLVFLGAAPLIGAIVYLASQYFRKISHKIQNAVGKISHVATESIQGVKLVKSFSGQEYEKNRFKQALEKNLTLGEKFSRVNAIQTPLLHFILAIALAIVFYIISIFWEGNSSTAIVFASLAGAVTKPFRQLSRINSLIQKGMAAADTVFNVLDMNDEKNDGTKTLARAKGQIEFKDVEFSYLPISSREAKQGSSPNNDRALNRVSFKVNAGQNIALVGSSGSGKSTITNLLLRFYNPQKGNVLIDGNNINDLTLDSLRANIALVNQQTILFNDTIFANIGYGGQLDENQEEKIIEAAKLANAHEFISDLPNGYNTLAGEDGARLSGGQRQRIAIARALYKNAPILILDEATSALDNESESRIQSALDTLKHNRTTLTVAHRLSTIEHADMILVMDQGEIIETGTHKTLLAHEGAYAKLYHSQFSGPDNG